MEKELTRYGYSPADYLKKAKSIAKAMGYNPRTLAFSDNGIHKLMIIDNKGRKRRFGRVGYGDYILYQFLEKRGEVPKGTANKKRERFHKSHLEIEGDWKKDDYSPNWLALRILW